MHRERFLNTKSFVLIQFPNKFFSAVSMVLANRSSHSRLTMVLTGRHPPPSPVLVSSLEKHRLCLLPGGTDLGD